MRLRRDELVRELPEPGRVGECVLVVREVVGVREHSEGRDPLPVELAPELVTFRLGVPELVPVVPRLFSQGPYELVVRVAGRVELVVRVAGGVAGRVELVVRVAGGVAGRVLCGHWSSFRA